MTPRQLIARILRAAPAVALAALLLPALAACASSGSTSGKIDVVAGENFYGDLVSRVGGDLVSVTSILSDPNVDPHTYESSTQNAQQVADAALVVENGLGYDAFLDLLMGATPSGSRTVVNVQKLLGVADGSNPHLWYDPAHAYPLDALAGKVDFVAHARLLRGTEERGQKVNDIIRNIVSFVIISFGITLLFRTIRGHQRPDALEDLGAREWLRYLQVV